MKKKTFKLCVTYNNLFRCQDIAEKRILYDKISSVYQLDVEDQNIRVEEGDRLGLMVPSDDFVPILASHTPAMTSTIFHK